jgi:hypothetical protein
MMAWTLFYNPVPPISDFRQLLLVLPLLLSIAIVYKAVRTKNLRHLPLETLWAFLYMVGGLMVLGVVLWVVTAWIR